MCAKISRSVVTYSISWENFQLKSDLRGPGFNNSPYEQISATLNAETQLITTWQIEFAKIQVNTRTEIISIHRICEQTTHLLPRSPPLQQLVRSSLSLLSIGRYMRDRSQTTRTTVVFSFNFELCNKTRSKHSKYCSHTIL